MAMRKHRVRSSGRTFIAVLLVAVAVILAVAVWKLSDAASANREDPALWGYLSWMTYLATVLLLMTLAFLAMGGVRWVLAQFRPPPARKPTSQVSAWEEAGRRFELPADDRGEDDESPSDA